MLFICISEPIQLVTISSQSTCTDAIQPLQGFNMHPTITFKQQLLRTFRVLLLLIIVVLIFVVLLLFVWGALRSRPRATVGIIIIISIIITIIIIVVTIMLYYYVCDVLLLYYHYVNSMFTYLYNNVFIYWETENYHVM